MSTFSSLRYILVYVSLFLVISTFYVFALGKLIQQYYFVHSQYQQKKPPHKNLCHLTIQIFFLLNLSRMYLKSSNINIKKKDFGNRICYYNLVPYLVGRVTLINNYTRDLKSIIII